MPIYAFTCEALRARSTSRAEWRRRRAGRLPGLRSDARRVFTPPGLALLAKPLRGALDREEKSAHEPDVVAGKTGRPMPHRHAPRRRGC